MPKILRTAIPAAVLTLGLWSTSIKPAYATKAYATKEAKTCVYCHVSATKPDLNAAGDYYAAHDHSMKGYKPPRKGK